MTQWICDQTRQHEQHAILLFYCTWNVTNFTTVLWRNIWSIDTFLGGFLTDNRFMSCYLRIFIYGKESKLDPKINWFHWTVWYVSYVPKHCQHIPSLLHLCSAVCTYLSSYLFIHRWWGIQCLQHVLQYRTLRFAKRWHHHNVCAGRQRHGGFRTSSFGVGATYVPPNIHLQHATTTTYYYY